VKRPDLIVHGRTFDPASFRLAMTAVETLASARHPWMPCAEEHRSGSMAIRLSTSLSHQLTLSILEQGSSVASVETPWDVGGGREIDDAGAAVRSTCGHMRLFTGPTDDIGIVDAWIMGIAGLVHGEGGDPLLVRLPGPDEPLDVLDAKDMQSISSPLVERLRRVCPTTLQIESGDDGDTTWIHPSIGLTGREEPHSIHDDPLATLRAIAFVRARMEEAA